MKCHKKIKRFFLCIFLIFLSCTESSDNKLEKKDIINSESNPLHVPSIEEKSVRKPEVKNIPPKFTSVKLMPEVFRPGDTLYIDAEAMDPDGDEVTIYYEWYKNGELVSTEKNLNIPVERGDKLIIKIKPFDGKDYGEVITLNREILNLPPVIIEHRDYHFDGNIFTYHVKATDPDGDDLSYSLKSSPPGMTINSSTGLILWNVPPDFKDRASVTVSVTDGHGGEAFYSFIVTIRSEER